jgi:hypothetical protein
MGKHSGKSGALWRLGAGKLRLKRAQVAQVSPMSRLRRLCRACVAVVSPKSRTSRKRRVYRANVALHALYCRLDLHCNMCLCEATQDRVSTPFSCRADFEFAELAHNAALNKDHTDDLLRLIWRIAEGHATLTFKSHRDVSSAWDRAASQMTPVRGERRVSPL